MGGKKKKVLDAFGSDDEGAGEDAQVEHLRINKDFAKRFEAKNRRDELFRAKERGLLDQLEESSSEDEEEDENGQALTGKMDFDIMKTISMIRNKDKRIYDSDFRAFGKRTKRPDDAPADDDVVSEAKDGASSDSDSDSDSSSAGNGGDENSNKIVRYKDLERQKMLRKLATGDADSGDEGEDDNEDDNGARVASKDGLSYFEQQELAKKAFKSAAAGESDSGDDDQDDEEGDGLLQLKKKSKAEKQAEEDEFQRYMSSLKAKDRKVSKAKQQDVQMLESLFKDAPKDKGEEFLRNFVLNEGWVNKNSVDDMSSDEEDEDDLEELEKADKFEAQYNFRFEEPGGDTIESHPRFDDSTVRRRESTRKRQRDSKKQRKQEEKERAKEELRRLKALKRQELEERLKRTAAMAGVDDEKLAFNVDDLEGDFDPEEWDKKMAATFNDDYYNEDDENMAGHRSDEDDIGGYEDVDDEDADKGESAASNIIFRKENAEAGEEQGEDEEGGQKLSKSARRRLRKRHGILVEASEPLDSADGIRKLDPFEQELYKLDYEDIIAGGLKTRFRYRKVKPNSYGLTAEEILNADDKLLQSFVSVKQMAPYRDDDLLVTSKRRRRFREAYRKSLKEEQEARAGSAKALVPNPAVDELFSELEAKKSKAAAAAEEAGADANTESEPVEAEGGEDGAKKTRKRKRKRNKKADSDEPSAGQEDDAEPSAGQGDSADGDALDAAASSVAEPDVAESAAAEQDGEAGAKRKRKRKRSKKTE